MTTTATVVPCYFEEDVSMNREFAVEIYSCPDPATWLAYVPPTGQPYDDPRGTLVASCGDHLLTVEADAPDVEVVQISTLSLTCSSCHVPVWAKYAHDHEIVQAADCKFCRGLRVGTPLVAEHAACSCPEESAYLRAMEGIES